jgi:hypothetical protein
MFVSLDTNRACESEWKYVKQMTEGYIRALKIKKYFAGGEGYQVFMWSKEAESILCCSWNISLGARKVELSWDELVSSTEFSTSAFWGSFGDDSLGAKTGSKPKNFSSDGSRGLLRVGSKRGIALCATCDWKEVMCDTIEANEWICNLEALLCLLSRNCSKNNFLNYRTTLTANMDISWIVNSSSQESISHGGKLGKTWLGSGESWFAK